MCSKNILKDRLYHQSFDPGTDFPNLTFLKYTILSWVDRCKKEPSAYLGIYRKYFKTL